MERLRGGPQIDHTRQAASVRGASLVRDHRGSSQDGPTKDQEQFIEQACPRNFSRSSGSVREKETRLKSQVRPCLG